MVELVNIHTLEAMLNAIRSKAFTTSADISKLHNLRDIVYKTDLVPLDLVHAFELAEYEFSIHTKPATVESNRDMLRPVYN